MSDTIPKFKIGDSVRIMQTTDMVDKGMANKHGVIIDLREASPSINAMAQVELIGGKKVAVPQSSLMRHKSATT